MRHQGFHPHPSLPTSRGKGFSNVRDLPLGPGNRVLVRVDYNVPFKPGTREISDDSRISATLPTIRYLTDRGCRVILCSHLGRPGGRRNKEDSLQPVKDRLSELLCKRVRWAKDCVGEDVKYAVSFMDHREILLLENLRFHAGEEANDETFAAQLAEHMDYYVNDAFGAAHRKHASTFGVAKLLPSAAGLLMEREIEALGRITRSPDHPYVVVVGGAKVADKLPVIENLSGVADTLLIGGGMVAAFLSARGYGWRADPGEREAAARILNGAARGGYEVVLPVDAVVANRFDEDARARNVWVGGASHPHPNLPPSRGKGLLATGVIMDIGPATVRRYAERLASARTVVWNGPMGVFEWDRFAHGTRRIAQAIAGLDDAYTVTGGGSTSDAVRALGLDDRFSHVSTGGGATLQFLEGRVLPGIAALDDV